MHSPARGKSQQLIPVQAAQINPRWQFQPSAKQVESLYVPAPAKPLNPRDTHCPDMKPELKLRQHLGCIFPSQELLPQLSLVPHQQLPLSKARCTFLPLPCLFPGDARHSPCWQRAGGSCRSRSSPRSSRRRAGMVAAGPGLDEPGTGPSRKNERLVNYQTP